ncbi:MAG: histidinol-phosphate transaminase [bacterium]
MKKYIQKHIFNIQPYQPGKPVQEVQRELGLRDVLKLASNENLLGPSPRALDALREHAEELNYYPDGGCYYLRKKIAEKFSVTFDNIVIGNGTDEIIRILCHTFLDPDTEIVMGSPSFVMYRISAAAMGAGVVEVPLRDHTIDLDGMLERISGRTRIVFISNPNNPTGTIVKRNEVKNFLNKAPDHVCVVFDEAYFEYVDDPEFADGMKYFTPEGRAVVLRTFSKIYGLAGLRIGYGFLPDDIADAFNRVRNPFNVNQAAQEAAAAALDDDEHVQNSTEFNRRGRELLYRELHRAGFDFVPTQANFVLMNVGADSEKVFRALLHEGVIVRPGRFLGYPQHIRVTIGSEDACVRFVMALKKVLVK